MSETIIAIIGRLIGALLVCFVAYITPKVNTWLNLKSESEATALTIELIREFVAAADQLFKADDPTGEIRNKYVKKQLEQLGYTITEEINAYIEASVYYLLEVK